MESDGKAPEDQPATDTTRSDDKRDENATRRGRPFEPGNQAAVGFGRPKKDFDLVTRCQELTEDIVEHYATMGRTATTGPEVEAGKIVLAYAHGKPRARLEHSGPGGGPIQIAAVATTEQKRARLRQIARDSAARVGAQGELPPVVAAAAEAEDGDQDNRAAEDAEADGAAGS